VLEVDDLIAATPEAYAALWHHCLHVDLVTSVTAANRSSVEVLPELLVDRRAVQEEERADFLWVRLLDIEAALAARRYRVADRVVLEVVGDGRFVLEGGPDGATCTRTDAAADLVIAVADLGACYLGDSRLWTAEAAGRAVALKAGAVSAFDRMFGTDAPPWCNTWF
jgi:predicted acetyltransferase